MKISVRLHIYALLRFLLTIASVDTADILSGDRALTAAELAVLPAITEEATGAMKAEAQSSAAAAATQAATTFMILFRLSWLEFWLGFRELCAVREKKIVPGYYKAIGWQSGEMRVLYPGSGERRVFQNLEMFVRYGFHSLRIPLVVWA